MNTEVKASMGDEDTIEKLPRRPKIIIRKLRKRTTSEPKPSEELKKVNGEVLDVNKGKKSDSPVKIVSKNSNEPVLIKPIEGIKRKLSESADDVIVLDDDSAKSDERNEGDSDVKDNSSPEFKGFKKRILAQSGKSKDNDDQIEQDASSNVVQKSEKVNPKAKVVKVGKFKRKAGANGKKGEGDEDDAQGESQTEYAQYLGLQPTMQFKCYRCGEKGFPSLLALNMHQRVCGNSNKSNFIANLQQDVTPSDPNMLTNFRITRKVYLCSACGTYYENWNLFLHMRDVHKKHICLFCLTMFGIADKLADHLKTAHSVRETSFKSSEEFQSIYKGSCYLICCSCENMFNERDDYFRHNCVKRDPTAKCTLCGVKCGHYYTCPNSSNTSSLPAPLTGSANSQAASTKNQTKGSSKYSKTSKATSNSTEEPWMGKKGQRSSVETDDDYDVSDAATFCHVDLADESGEKDKSRNEGSSDNPVEISDNETLTADEPIDEKNSQPTDTLEPNKSDSSEDVVDSEPTISETDDNLLKPQNNVSEENQNSMIESQEKEDSSEGDKITNLQEDKVTQDKIDTKNTDNSIENEDSEKSSQEKTDLEAKESSQTTCDDLTDKTEINKDKSQIHEENLKDNSNSSESDGDLDGHKSASQEDSDSSSDESSEGESQKDNGKQSTESKGDDSESENNNRAESKMEEDEQPSSPSTSFEEKNKTVSQPKASQESNDTSKDFHLDDDLVEDKLKGSDSEGNVPISPVQDESKPDTAEETNPPEEISDGIPLAGEDVPAMALTLEDKLEIVSASNVVKECVRTSCQNCVYCSHAIKIAVNGKQLALHLVAEHRYKPIKNNETSQDVVQKLKGSLSELESLFFNTDSYDSADKSLNTSYDYTYECFQCRFVTKIHKELYVHKRKMHQKTVLLCVMCKANFYSYSELLCHMCPGVYVSDDVNFRCCFCNLDMIPSAFRLMVHLRKGHHTCDICLEVAGDQQKLSTHMWKHKLNHLCYRCGIAYRNKPDITKHLFWKHGTESVLCKKCLQKKWPHVYHFCIPPTVFICEECNMSFTKAVALKVHKRLHGGELPYACNKCEKRFVSKKLVNKHEGTHNQPQVIEKPMAVDEDKHDESTDEHINVESIDELNSENVGKDSISNETSKEAEVKSDVTPETKSKKKKKKDKDKKGKHVVDVYNLPPLNLSSESDSSGDEAKQITAVNANENTPTESKITHIDKGVSNEIGVEEVKLDLVEASEDNQGPVPVVDGVWDSFHSYKAELEKRESKDLTLPNILPSTSETLTTTKTDLVSEKPAEEENIFDVVAFDHSYCLIPGKPKPTGNEGEDQLSPTDPAPVEATPQESPAPRGHSSSIDHAYATLNTSSAEGVIATPAPPDPVSLNEVPKTPPPSVPATSQDDATSSSKKKPKTPKKKKHTNNTTNSSSSSDSSSDSDSSTCTCGTNCSCSSSSSNSSSSSSSDSDSSTSEGRRRVTAKREKKKERLKHKHIKEESTPIKPVEQPLPPVKEEPVLMTPVEPVELPIRESDLDTDESSTDEDFYDKYPQSHAKQQLEKRNKLMLLASVAPVNNGTASPPLPPPEPPVEETPPPPPPPVSKKKIKSKRRRKSQQSKKSANKPSSHVQVQPSTSLSFPNASSTPHVPSHHQHLTPKPTSPQQTPHGSFHSDTAAGSGSENESARLSKRKRVRNKFYGYSSEEEGSERPGLKWRRVDPPVTPPVHPAVSYQPTPQRPQAPIVAHIKRPKPPSESSGSDDEPFQPPKPEYKSSNNSSSSSSESENEPDVKPEVPKEQTEKSDNLYCYCQCPYDEVSEMIACDGQDCTIEWFHFECVGIMVPPKGKWYCPDCRKRRDLM